MQICIYILVLAANQSAVQSVSDNVHPQVTRTNSQTETEKTTFQVRDAIP